MTTILTIEDETSIRENIQDILELEGFSVLTAANGKIGLQLARQNNPDLIICDVMMPELDGYDVLTSLRQDPTTIKIPFLFLSAQATKADFRKGMSLGADDYITKPFTHKELLEAISIRLERQKMMMARYTAELERALLHSPSTILPLESTAVAVNCITTSVKVIQPTGALDVTNCAKLRQEIIEVANTGYQHVLVDCQQLTFMDSSGLAALVLASQKVHESNSQLSICSIAPPIEMLFALTNMNDIIKIFSTPMEFYSNYDINN